MNNRLKLFLIKMLRILMHVFYIFPVKDKVFLFSSYEGRQYSDNPKYLYLYIKEKFGDKYSYIWVLNTTSKELNTVKFLSLRHLYYLTTAKYIISNLGIEPFIPKRNSQISINTWHGSGAYKCQTLNEKSLKNNYSVNCRDYRAQKTSFYISGCKKYSEISAVSWNASLEKFLSTGTPRNDVLFSNNLLLIKKQVLHELNVPEDCGYLLYAPTFRGLSYRNHAKLDFTIDFDKILILLEKKYNRKFKVFYREHVGYKEGSMFSKDYIVDVSNYPDMQQLMIASDILITDYSSCMWDFSFLNRPGFLYVPDLQEYLSERDFYTPIDSWPFDYATNLKSLIDLIENYDDEVGNKKILEHHKSLGSYEHGNACEQILEVIELI